MKDKLLETKEIRVYWDTLSRQEATAWHPWIHESLDPSEEDQNIEKGLDWSPGTLSILRKAFKFRLNRNIGWDLTHITHPEAYQLAAQAFMRGAHYRPKNRQATHQKKGAYTIRITERPDPNFYALLDSCFVVCDAEVQRAWPQFLQDRCDYILHNVCESIKTLDTVAKLRSKAPTLRPWLIIGGGISCDLAAYAAHLHGVSFTLVPTTLLAMVDASVGGKTGVNFLPFGKNLVGAFAFPQSVQIYTQWLQTLPSAEFYAGAGECFKHALLAGPAETVARLSQIFANQDLHALTSLLPSLLQVKIDIVQRDPFEHGERAILNAGHTLAHALEAVALQSNTGFYMRHGHAVTVGLLFEIQLSYELGHISCQDFHWICDALMHSGACLTRKELEQSLGHPLASCTLVQQIINCMSIDKKSNSTDIPFIILQAVGKTVRTTLESWVVNLEKNWVAKRLETFLQNY